jgi:hypothetical protein
MRRGQYTIDHPPKRTTSEKMLLETSTNSHLGCEDPHIANNEPSQANHIQKVFALVEHYADVAREWERAVLHVLLVFIEPAEINGSADEYHEKHPERASQSPHTQIFVAGGTTPMLAQHKESGNDLRDVDDSNNPHREACVVMVSLVNICPILSLTWIWRLAESKAG